MSLDSESQLNFALQSDGGRKEVAEMQGRILNQRARKEEILLPSASYDLCHTCHITSQSTPPPPVTHHKRKDMWIPVISPGLGLFQDFGYKHTEEDASGTSIHQFKKTNPTTTKKNYNTRKNPSKLMKYCIIHLHIFLTVTETYLWACH